MDASCSYCVYFRFEELVCVPCALYMSSKQWALSPCYCQFRNWFWVPVLGTCGYDLYDGGKNCVTVTPMGCCRNRDGTTVAGTIVCCCKRNDRGAVVTCVNPICCMRCQQEDAQFVSPVLCVHEHKGCCALCIGCTEDWGIIGPFAANDKCTEFACIPCELHKIDETFWKPCSYVYSRPITASDLPPRQAMLGEAYAEYGSTVEYRFGFSGCSRQINVQPLPRHILLYHAAISAKLSHVITKDVARMIAAYIENE